MVIHTSELSPPPGYVSEESVWALLENIEPRDVDLDIAW